MKVQDRLCRSQQNIMVYVSDTMDASNYLLLNSALLSSVVLRWILSQSMWEAGATFIFDKLFRVTKRRN